MTNQIVNYKKLDMLLKEPPLAVFQVKNPRLLCYAFLS